MATATEEQKNTGKKKQARQFITLKKVLLKVPFLVNPQAKTSAEIDEIVAVDGQGGQASDLLIHKNSTITLRGRHLTEYDHVYVLVSSAQSERIEDLQLWEPKNAAGIFLDKEPVEVTFKIPDFDQLVETKASLFIILESDRAKKTIRPILLNSPSIAYVHTAAAEDERKKKAQREDTENQRIDQEIYDAAVLRTDSATPSTLAEQSQEDGHKQKKSWEEESGENVTFEVAEDAGHQVLLAPVPFAEAEQLDHSAEVDIGQTANVPFALGNSNVTALLNLLSAEEQQDAQAIATALASRVSQNIEDTVTIPDFFSDKRYRDIQVNVLEQMRQNLGASAQYDPDELHAAVTAQFKYQYPEEFKQYIQKQVKQSFLKPVQDPAVRKIFPQVTAAIDTYFSQVPRGQRSSAELRQYLSAAVPQQVWVSFTEQFPEKAFAYARQMPALSQIIRQTAYADVQQDPAVRQLNANISLSVEKEMSAAARSGNYSAQQQAEQRQKLTVAARQDELTKFALQYPQKAAAYQGQIEGLAEVLRTGSLGSVVGSSGATAGAAQLFVKTVADAGIRGKDGVNGGSEQSASVRNQRGADAGTQEQQNIGIAPSDNLANPSGQPAASGKNQDMDGIAVADIPPDPAIPALSEHGALSDEKNNGNFPLARQSQIPELINKASQIPKARGPVDAIQKTAAAGEALANAIPHPEASKYAPILQKIKNADLTGQSPLSKADKGLQLAREISGLAGRHDVADKIGQIHEGFGEVRPEVESAIESLREGKSDFSADMTLDQKFARNAQRIQKVLKVTEKVAQLTGQDELAAMAGELGGLAGPGADERGGQGGANFVGNRAANLAKNFPDSKTGKAVNKGLGKAGIGPVGKGLSQGASKALGGVVAGAMQGEGALGIAQNALSWYVLDIAFGSLLTPWSPVALVYLNFHYLASKLGSKWFRKPSTWQSAGILGADITYFVGVLLVFLLLMVSICNHPLYKTVSFFTGQAQICKNFDAAVLTKTGMSSLLNASPGSFTCSGTRYCTNNWDGKIMQYSSQYGIDACILKTVIEKESAGNASAIGYDNDPKRGSFDISQPPKYNLDWNYSHGIGLTQWTIFPVQGGNQWVDGNTPSRNLAQIDIHPGQWYTVADFLNPDVSLSLTARRFAVDMTQSGGNLQQAFRSYNGSGPKADQYAVDSMRLYNICKGNGTVSP